MGQRAELSTFAVNSTGFADVSLITGDMEPQGHGFYIDGKTIDTATRALLGKSLRAHLKHDGAGGDRLGQEVGFFTGIYRDGLKIKAKGFEFLDAFKREASTTYEKLVEMAKKVPDQLGVSLVFEYSPVWVMGDGSEIPAKLGSKAPTGAIRGTPSARVKSVIAGDLVQRGAANPNGLLSADSTETKTKMADETKTISLDAHTAELTAQTATHTAALEKLTTEHTAALAAKDAEIAKLTTDHTAQLAALSEANKAELAKVNEAHTAALAEKDKIIAEQKMFDARHLGVAPIRVAQAQLAQKTAGLTTPKEKLEFYEKLPAGAEKEAFRKTHAAELFAALSAQ